MDKSASEIKSDSEPSVCVPTVHPSRNISLLELITGFFALVLWILFFCLGLFVVTNPLRKELMFGIDGVPLDFTAKIEHIIIVCISFTLYFRSFK